MQKRAMQGSLDSRETPSDGADSSSALRAFPYLLLRYLGRSQDLADTVVLLTVCVTHGRDSVCTGMGRSFRDSTTPAIYHQFHPGCILAAFWE